MRILQFVNTLDSLDGGPARNSLEVNQAINGVAGMTACLIVARGSFEGSTLSSDLADGRRLRGPAPRFIVPRGGANRITLTSLLRAIAGADVAIIHGYFLTWVPLLVVALRLARVPFVIMPHGAISAFEKSKGSFLKRYFDSFARRIVDPACYSFVVGSDRERDDVKALKPRSRVVVVGVGARLSIAVDHDVVDHDDRTLQLVSISRISPKKRVDLMLECASVLSEQGVPFTLTIAGSGSRDLLDSLAAHAAERRLTQVSFVGEVRSEDKARLLARADVFLLPSDDENFGIGMAEALAAGVPCVVSDRVAAAEQVSLVAAQRLSRPTGESLAEAVVKLRAVDAWHEASAAAKSDAMRAFDWNQVAERWVKVLTTASRHADV